MKQRILYLITLLVVCFCCFCVSEDETRVKMYEKCINGFPFDGMHLYYFQQSNDLSKRILSSKFFDEETMKNAVGAPIGGDSNIDLSSMILTCICRQTFDPIFYLSPSFNIFGDVYVYCVPGKKPSKSEDNSEAYDSEAYDTLLFQYTQKIPNTLMTPFLNEKTKYDSVACFDIDGFPIKNIANQETCLLAAEKSDDNQVQVYSGPLLSSVLSNLKKILSAQQFFDKWCYTSVKDTIEKLPGKCTMFMIEGYPLFFCCYAKKSEKLEIQKVLDQKERKDKFFKRLFCASSSEISLQDYRDHYIGYACCAKVTVEYFWKEKSAEYFVSDSSKSGSSGLCSSKPGNPEKVAIVKCCHDGHFCNLKLFPIHFKWNYQRQTKCLFKPDISLYFDDSDICEVYYDLVLEKQVYLHENISVKIIHETKLPGTRVFVNPTKYYCSYAYAEIINADKSGCEDEIGSVKSVYRCTCGVGNCDGIFGLEPYPVKKFSCQFLPKIQLEFLPENIGFDDKPDKWICYVIIIKPFAESHTEVVAGHFDHNGNNFKECLNGDVIESELCCVNLFNIEKENQENSECTVQKQIQRFKSSRNSKDPENSSNHDDEEDANKKDKPVPEITHCYSKDIELMDARTESEHCPKSDGCFSTRILQTSEAASETEIEPAGCLGYAEDYTLENLDLTSLSLGCRVKENWGRCSVVQSPSGEKRIVCCCNEPDENGFCNTKLTEVPEQIGKNISSFKEL